MITEAQLRAQEERNQALLTQTPHIGTRLETPVLPFELSLDAAELSDGDSEILAALEKEAARIAVQSLATLAKINEVDHLGGGLELIPSLLMTLAVVDYQRSGYTIEHAHTSIGYYSALAALGYISPERVVNKFRQSLDIAGHVAWVPGGTELNGGRLGVMVPAVVGYALGLRAYHDSAAFAVCHCGDAGWISGQALNGFNAASLHKAPIFFIMHRNGIQLSGTTREIMDRDPRTVIASLGITILETPSLHDRKGLFQAYREARRLAFEGKPSLIYPTGWGAAGKEKVTLGDFGTMYGVTADLEQFAGKHGVALDKEVWIPGSLMSFRDVKAMMECLFLVNGLPGGEGHHDGHLKGRDAGAILSHPLMTLNDSERKALEELSGRPRRQVITEARPRPGTKQLELPPEVLAEITLPDTKKAVSARAGVEAAYGAVAKAFPKQVFSVSCDLNPSTKLGKAASYLPPMRIFEVSIEEQAATLIANGLSLSTRDPQMVIVATFAAFYEGIAREGFEMWRYTRNLDGVNEGLNVIMHLSHVGACTGRDHFSGWSLDWINLSLGYLPYLYKFYAPADARSAFVAIRDAAAHYGAKIIGIPRDNLPILTDEDGAPLWDVETPWEPITSYRKAPGAKKAVLALGATAMLLKEVVDSRKAAGEAVDAFIVNGFPVTPQDLRNLIKAYPEGIVTVEDGLIGDPASGLRGFAAVAAGIAGESGIPARHIGIVNPRVAPSDGHMEVWAHFGITVEDIIQALAA